MATPNGSPLDILSERELQIMMMITGGQKVQEISDKLCLSPKTVNSYRYRLFDKLDVASDVELTHLAIRHGILDTEKLNFFFFSNDILRTFPFAASSSASKEQAERLSLLLLHLLPFIHPSIQTIKITLNDIYRHDVEKTNKQNKNKQNKSAF